MPFSNIDKPSKYFNTKLYTGNGSTNVITGVGFKPDLLWLKSRSLANRHILFDIVRGTYSISSDSTSAEVNRASDGFTSLDSDGFSLNGNGTGGDINQNSATYVAWNFLGANTTASNTSGTITSTVSANTTSGFSIVSYTGNGTAGATVGHGLGVAPKMLIAKNRQTASNWAVWHTGIPMNEHLILNGTQASSVYTGFFNNTSPTSTLVTLGNDTVTNENTKSIILYCFAEVKGFSKFGSYVGNGSTDGTFSYTGFRPAFLMLKRTDTTGSWQMYDNKRDTYNPEISRLGANLSSEESTSASIYIDFLSNGFKMRNSTADWNASGGTYIYMCFAEQPFTSSKGIVANAR